MSESFLETDETLQALIDELMKLKSASEQLKIAEGNISELLRACNRIVTYCGQLAERNKVQLDATVRLTHEVEERMNFMADDQKVSAMLSEQKLNTITHTMAILDERVNFMIDDQKASATLTEQKLNTVTHAMATNERVVNGMAHTLETRGQQLDLVDRTLHNEVQPLLQRLKSTIGVTRLVAFVLVALTLANGALTIYVMRLLSS